MKLDHIISTLMKKQTDIQAIMEKAGTAVMKIYHDPATMNIQVKSDTSPLTAADTASHNIITQNLPKHFPEWPILSEESDEASTLNKAEWPVYWLIDPLDGTKEFINHSDEFTLNLALIVEGIPRAGWVSAPAIGEHYQAIGDQTTYMKGDEISTFQSRPVAAIPQLLMSRRHGTELMDQAKAIFESLYGPCDTLSRGSSLKICEVAIGRADFYPRLGPTHEWDTAAAHAVLNAAGGALVNLSNQALTYNQTEHTLNPYFMAIGDPNNKHIAQLLSELKVLCKEDEPA